MAKVISLGIGGVPLLLPPDPAELARESEALGRALREINKTIQDYNFHSLRVPPKLDHAKPFIGSDTQKMTSAPVRISPTEIDVSSTEERYTKQLKTSNPIQLQQRLSSLENELFVEKQPGHLPVKKLSELAVEMHRRGLNMAQALSMLERVEKERSLGNRNISSLVTPALCEIAPGHYAPQAKDPLRAPPLAGRPIEVTPSGDSRLPLPLPQAPPHVPSFPELSPPDSPKLEGRPIAQKRDDYLVHNINGNRAENKISNDSEHPPKATSSKTNQQPESIGIDQAALAADLTKNAIANHLETLAPNQEVLVLGHFQPDPDCVSAMLTVGEMAKQSTNNPVKTIFVKEQTGRTITDWLQPHTKDLDIEFIKESELGEILAKHPRIIVVDTHETRNTALKDHPETDKTDNPVMFIDHHQYNDQAPHGLVFTKFPSLTLALAQGLNTPIEAAAGLTGILTDTGADLGTVVSPIGKSLIHGENARDALLATKRANFTSGIDMEGHVNFKMLTAFHQGLNDGTIDPQIVKPELVDWLKSSRTLATLTKPENSSTVATLDTLLRKAINGGAKASQFMDEYFSESAALVKEASRVVEHQMLEIEDGQERRKLSVNFIPSDSSHFAYAMGLVNLEHYSNHGGKAGDARLSVTPVGSTHKASVLLSGPYSETTAKQLDNDLRNHDIGSGATGAILGDDRVVRVGTYVPRDRLQDYYLIVSRYIDENNKVRPPKKSD